MTTATQPTTGLASQGGHWYRIDGAPAYEIQAKNGNMRAVTLRDARKLNLYPSVTTILGCSAKPGLERWKIQQAVLSALTLPRIEGETEDAFALRVIEDSKEQARKAAALGTLLHEQIELSFSNRTDPEWLPYVEPVRAWLDKEFPAVEWLAEKSFAHPSGFGGKVDLCASEPAVVIDFKTKDFGPDDDVKAWDEHGIQLAAYASGLQIGTVGPVQRWNLFVSTRVPGLIRPWRWDDESFDRHWTMFCCLLDFWQADKNYAPDPRKAA